MVNGTTTSVAPATVAPSTTVLSGCITDTRAPQLANAMHIAGCCVSLILVVRLLYVYWNLRLIQASDPSAPLCHFPMYTRAAHAIRRRLGALYGHQSGGDSSSSHPNNTNLYFDEANRSVTTVVTPDRPPRPAGDASVKGSPPPSQARVTSIVVHESNNLLPPSSAALMTTGNSPDNFAGAQYGTAPSTVYHHPHHGHQQQCRAESDLLISLQGVTLGDLNRWVRHLQNPINDGIACAVVCEMLQCLFEMVAAVGGLAMHSHTRYWRETEGGHNNTTQGGAGVAIDKCAELVLEGGFCDFSATTEQFFDGGAMASFLLVVACVAFPNLLRRTAATRRTFAKFLVGTGFALGVVTTVVMWAALPQQPWGSRFSASMPWCWVPNDDYSGRMSGGGLVALRMVLGYAFPILIIIFGVKAYFAVTSAVLTAIRARVSGYSLSFILPRSYRAIVRRFLPQIFVLVLLYGCAALTRFLSGSQEAVTVVVSTLVSLIPAFNVTIWANGEGFLWPAFGLGGLEDAVGESFTQLVMDCYGMAWGDEAQSQPGSRPPSEVSEGPPLDIIRSFAGSAVGY